MKNSADALLDLAFNMFYSETKLHRINVNVEFVTNMYNRRLELEEEFDRKNEIIAEKQFISNCTGMFVLGKYMIGAPYILISDKQVTPDLLFIETAIHELTHAHDHLLLSEKFDTMTSKELERLKVYSSFYYWTEFHAKRNGCYFLNKINKMAQESPSRNKDFETIQTVEFPCLFQKLILSLSNVTNNANLYVYFLVNFLGVISVWKDQYYNEIDTLQLLGPFRDNFGEGVNDLFDFLYQNKEFGEVFDKFDDLELLINLLISTS